MRAEFLQAILRKEQVNAGFHLEEDDHFVLVCDAKGITRCIFSADGTTPEAIQNEVDELMASQPSPAVCL
jgi:hypothetical protein